MHESDQELIATVREGNADAFRLLVERHTRGVYKLAYRMTGNPEQAEDVVQEVFLRAWRQLDRYESRSSFSTWLYRITSNYCLDLLRGRRPSADSLHVLPRLASAEPLPDQLAHASQIRRDLGQALNSLSEQERCALVLRHWQGCSIEQVASALAVSDTAAKNSIFRAVRKVRSFFDSRNPAPVDATE